MESSMILLTNLVWLKNYIRPFNKFRKRYKKNNLLHCVISKVIYDYSLKQQ